jgi:hypothetical protein
METISSDEAVVCSKNDILLKRKKNEDTFTLSFSSRNPRIKVRNVITFGLYELIGKLNKDVVEKIDIIQTHSPEIIDVLFLFKRFGAEFGIAQKYMFVRIERQCDEKQIRFMSKTVPYRGKPPKGCEAVVSDYANLYVDVNTEHEVFVSYVFHMNLQEELPIYMENIIGLLMKKIFFRLKTFIENIK